MGTSSVDPYRFELNNPQWLQCFFDNGFVVLKRLVNPSKIKETLDSFLVEYNELKQGEWSSLPTENRSALALCNTIRENHRTRILFDELPREPNLLDALERILGPDISLINGWEIVVSDPEDSSDVKVKHLHQEMWTGAGIMDVFTWLPLSEVEEENTMVMLPGSHFHGMLPNRNRRLMVEEGIDYGEVVPLTGFDPGDMVLFHSLILHGTAGIGKNLRVAISYYFKNTFAETSTKYHSVGQTPLREGTLNRISNVLGNDQYTPLRTYGGRVSNLPAYLNP